jgi:cellulose synthase/poly-beta-1,6-N-acetylglucosamine synthase-like glycosyltransferase
MMKAVFWLALLLIAYPYAIYPVLLSVLARRSKGAGAGARPELEAPRVCLIISAYNERGVMAEKLANCGRLDYPAGKLEILVVSDASVDGTDEIVRRVQCVDPRIRLLRMDARGGKSAGLNRAVAVANGDILVFSDANAMYDRNALRELASSFADPCVGYAVGAALYSEPDGCRAAENEGLYWHLELCLKRLESRFDSVVGGDGAIYAIRRSLFRPLQDDDISDFVNPLQIVAAGFRGRFNDRAYCYERAGGSFAKEFTRKRRIVNRSWRAVRRYGHLLNLRRNSRFIFMLISHKVIRWLALPLVLLAWLTGALLLGAGVLYVCAWGALTGSVLAACWGAVNEWRGRDQNRLLSLFYYFYLINLAGALGIWDEYRGVRYVTWDHVRGSRT